MNTASTYLSHPTKGNRKAIFLHEHLSKVAALSKEIAERMNPDSSKDAYLAGLLHDIGKLSPWYQERFAGNTIKELDCKYGVRQHSAFSAWVAQHLLFGKAGEHHVVHAVAGHHTKLRTRLHTPTNPKTTVAQTGMVSNLKVFLKHVCSDSVSESNAWRSLNWDGCMELFGCALNFEEKIKVNNGSVDTYCHAKCVFSALLQADRGSFHCIPKSEFSMKIQSTHETPTSDIGKLRKSFQDAAFASYLKNSGEAIVAIEAPTGIGKTELIIRILRHHSDQKGHNHAFYFSPLLALNDGFVNALMGGGTTLKPAVPRKADWDHILEYNHMTAEPIANRKDKKLHGDDDAMEQDSIEFYNMISFNYPFVVSTTARLLLTVYGNLARNCIKFASLSNSVIIVDEIQTVPRFLLKNLISVMSWIAKSSGSKVILVSATIPNEVSDIVTCKIGCDEHTAKKFAALTPKTLSVVPSLDVKAIRDAAPDMTAVIFNTRRRAASEFCRNANMLRKSYEEVIYITSGIRKHDRLEHIRRIAQNNVRSALVISTQVLEAGVDANFRKVFREMAPLDRIVQAMGRVNRHGGTEAAEIVVFDRNPVHPYRDVEVCETQKILDRITANKAVTSAEVYTKLREYYEKIALVDCKSIEDSKRLRSWMSEHDYDNVWEMVRKSAFTDYNVNVVIPYPNEALNIEREARFDTLQEDLNSTVNGSANVNKRNIMQRAARLSASLPEYALERIENLLDPELLKHDICFPRNNKSLTKMYDQNIGLDRWVSVGGASC